jgi:hypothetical protein
VGLGSDAGFSAIFGGSENYRGDVLVQSGKVENAASF